MKATGIQRLETIASALNDRLSTVVFVGSATLPLYAHPSDVPPPHLSHVDCLVNTSLRSFSHEWEHMLLDRGFLKQLPAQTPAWHWTYEGVEVHFLPPIPEALGFENRWFEEGMFYAQPYHLPSGQRIRCFPPVYFVASKFEALAHRGWDNLRGSSDFRDLIFLIRYRSELRNEIAHAFHEVRKFLQERAAALLAHPDLDEGLCDALPYPVSPSQISHLRVLMREIAEGGLQTRVMSS